MSDGLYQAPVFKRKQKPQKNTSEEKPLWKNPRLITAASLIIFLIVFFIYHVSFGKKLKPQASKSSRSFSVNSKYFSSGETLDLSEIQKKRMKSIGLKSEGSEVLNKKIQAKDYREQRKIMAISKYEAIRERADSRMLEESEKRRKYSSGTACQLKEAVMSLESSDLLGIMRLERLLEERYLSKGADSQELDSLVFAYTQLAKTYEKKQMQDKAKEAYINAFKLMKQQAPPEQSGSWDGAINSIQSLQAKKSR